MKIARSIDLTVKTFLFTFFFQTPWPDFSSFDNYIDYENLEPLRTTILNIRTGILILLYMLLRLFFILFNQTKVTHSGYLRRDDICFSHWIILSQRHHQRWLNNRTITSRMIKITDDDWSEIYLKKENI